MSEWQTCAVSDSFVKNKVGRQNQIPTKDIAQVGRFPVVDQGQEFVAGYCDDERRVIDFDLPLIIFGDHTRCFKYVDFPFVLGADGTKVLLPNKKLYDPKFYYFAMLALELPSRGYNRHFKTLKERSLPLPPLLEQKKIAHILSTVQRAIEAQERIIQTTTELKKALMHKLFTEGLRNEPQKQTEVGPVPQSWEVAELATLFEKQPQNGIYKHKRDYGSGTQILRIDDFSNDGDVVTRAGNLVTLARNEIGTYGLEPGDIVINRVNSLSHLGKTALIGAIGDQMVFESNMMRFSVDESQVLKEYVFKFLNSPLTKKQIIGTAKRAVAQSSINQGDVKSIIVPKPSLEEQVEIVAGLDAVEAKIAHSTDKAALLRDLFRTLLHELMTAKTRVHTIDFRPLT